MHSIFPSVFQVFFRSLIISEHTVNDRCRFTIASGYVVTKFRHFKSPSFGKIVLFFYFFAIIWQKLNFFSPNLLYENPSFAIIWQKRYVFTDHFTKIAFSLQSFDNNCIFYQFFGGIHNIFCNLLIKLAFLLQFLNEIHIVS